MAILLTRPHLARNTSKTPDAGVTHLSPVINKTWLFNSTGNLARWVRARRIGDAADGHGELFRVTADSRILTLGPDLRIRALRRPVWEDGSTADAVALWDDLRLGLFIRQGHLVLASWKAGR